MLSKIIWLKIVIGIALTSILLMATPLKTLLLDGTLLEANAHLNDLMKSPDSFLLSTPTTISGETQQEQESFKTNTLPNDALDAWFDRSQIQALIVQKKGRIVYERYGPATDNGRNINAMSMTKTIIAILIGVAIDDGFINSEKDSISQYLPEIAQRPVDPVTLQDLLRHTSGIKNASKDIRATLKGDPLITPLSDISFDGDRLFRYDNINYHLFSVWLLTQLNSLSL